MVCKFNFAVILASFIFLGAGEPPQPMTSKTVVFPGLGPVLVQALAPKGDYPQLQFKSVQSQKLLLRGNLANSEGWKSWDGTNGKEPMDVIVGFIILHESGLPDPLVIGFAEAPGGSDCSYTASLFGEVEGKLSQLTPMLPTHETRGGIFLSKPTSKGRITLSVTSERYNWDTDVHYLGPSRMAVFTYMYDGAQGRFVKSGETEVKTDKLSVSGEDLGQYFAAEPFGC